VSYISGTTIRHLQTIKDTPSYSELPPEPIKSLKTKTKTKATPKAKIKPPKSTLFRTTTPNPRENTTYLYISKC